MSSSMLPPSLKKINVFLKRAEELDRDKSNPESRVVAYNCRQYAALIGIPLVTSSSNSNDNEAAKKALGQLLTTLESEKTAMSVFSKAEHWKISRKVADRVFDKADAEDRGGVANKGTARSFYAAATFYEILQQFHDEEIKAKNNSGVEEELNEDEASIVEHMEEEDQRRVYCKWKATDILTAIKEGRVPQPGGYKKEEEEVVDDAENNTDGVVNNVDEIPPTYEDKNDVSLPPPAPSMPSSDLFEIPSQSDNYEKHSETNNMPPPPSYDGIELSLSGQPTTTTITDDTTAQETTNNDDLFIPAPPVAIPPPPVSAPPAYSQPNMSSINHNDNNSNNGGKGMFSSIFQSNKSSNTKKLTKAQMGDAIELTKFALAALQKGDGELGRERLEQALGVWK